MLQIDLRGTRAFVAGVADDDGFGFAIAKALAEAGATVCVGTWPPALGIFKALLENAASEQGARMSAMDNATRNAGDMIGRLTLRYNRTRQAMITKELIEIISGAEAL